MAWKTPDLRMVSASSVRPLSSKCWRGLVGDSISCESGISRVWALVVMAVVSMMQGSFRAVEGDSYGALPVGRPLQRSELANDALVGEDFREALSAKVLVPELGELFVLPVKLGVVAVVVGL